MSDISISTSIQITQGSYTRSYNDSMTADFTAATVIEGPGTIDVGTSEEVIAAVDVSTQDWAYIKNLDDTNFVTLGVKPAATYYPMLTLQPGEFIFIRLVAAVPLYAKADTAACILQAVIYEA